ncbi:MAG: response regulator [Cytophagales bacterium]|nr:response regulator [Cytophagales bacterium]MDW8383337.1 response regulator [Flammeovirgaceae bacterium]
MTICVLYIEDNLADFKLLAKKLEVSSPYGKINLCHCQTLKDATKYLEERPADLILLDLSLPDAMGMEGVNYLQSKFPSIPVVVLTGNTNTEVGLEAIRSGAQDYLVKNDYSIELFYKTCWYAVERKRIQTELQQTIEALQTEKKIVALQNQQIYRFVNVLVSDLKNPLISITALTELLLKDKQKLTATQLNYLTQIHYSSGSMLDNILSIIETTQLQEGNIPIQMLWENPYHTINAAIDKFIVEAITRDVLFDIKYDKNLPKAYFDKRLLHNVLSNLLEVSIAYTHKAARIKIQAEKQQENLLKISIFNNGFLLSDDELQNIFDDTTLSEAQQGLKLSLAKRMASLMEANIGIETSTKGTNLWVTLKTKH